jgi:hypothetical protein
MVMKMGRDATKAMGNIYFQKRTEAAKYNQRLLSREGAAELLGMSVSNLASIELGHHKCVPNDVVDMMADLYNAPELRNYYCMCECPLKHGNPLAYQIESIDKATIKVISAFRKADKTLEEMLVHMAAEEEEDCTEDIDRVEAIIKQLDVLMKNASALKLNIEKRKMMMENA